MVAEEVSISFTPSTRTLKYCPVCVVVFGLVSLKLESECSCTSVIVPAEVVVPVCINVKSSTVTLFTTSLKVTFTAKFFPCVPEPSTTTVTVGFLVSISISVEAIRESALPMVSVIVFVELEKTSKEYIVVESV